MARPTVIVTAGPSYEPIDEVRRITNSSTGELGVMLANRLARSGWPVLLLLGTGATVRGPLGEEVQVMDFATNADLLERLRKIASRTEVAAIFQAAALCDFQVREIRGQDAESAKISSRAGEVTLVLEPAAKVLGKLRLLFPASLLIGWKYELAGTLEDVMAKGQGQMVENGTALCVLNGRAYGEGFGILTADGSLHAAGDKAELCDWLGAWLEKSSVPARESSRVTPSDG